VRDRYSGYRAAGDDTKDRAQLHPRESAMGWARAVYSPTVLRLGDHVGPTPHPRRPCRVTRVESGRRQQRQPALPDPRQEVSPVSPIRFDHVGITVADLDAVTAFFVGLGLEVEGRMFMEGEFVDTVIGIPNSRSEIVTLLLPDGGTRLELSSFVRPDHEPGSPDAMATELGLRNVCFEVDDLEAILARLAGDGYGLVGGIGQYEDIWRMAYVRGPEGIIVALAQRIG
jgi:catechol 2,3-dioxygenase-like lactoylglutathione lyase family enzyme